jgi:DNA-directed RNA polymerase specialized sigma24 family protein
LVVLYTTPEHVIVARVMESGSKTALLTDGERLYRVEIDGLRELPAHDDRAREVTNRTDAVLTTLNRRGMMYVLDHLYFGSHGRPGRGHLERWDIPLVMAAGRSSEWSGHLRRYLEWSESDKRHFEEAFNRLPPRERAAFEAVVFEGQPVSAETARHLDMDRANFRRALDTAMQRVNEIMGETVFDVRDHGSRRKIEPRTDADVILIRQLRVKGLKGREIARKMNRSHGFVHKIVQELNL